MDHWIEMTLSPPRAKKLSSGSTSLISRSSSRMEISTSLVCSEPSTDGVATCSTAAAGGAISCAMASAGSSTISETLDSWLFTNASNAVSRACAIIRVVS
ncbi:Uncharacterised protein [Mycobacteroides abscessus subsp. abscessus]|nr:Uncharacterised protein [Mycobacteroides abscessus subsp. abscessus]